MLVIFLFGAILMTSVLNLASANRFQFNGSGRFKYVSPTQVKFVPYFGDVIRINGIYYLIPSAGVLGSNAGLAANTAYYVYLYVNAGVLTLEFSTTGHSTDTSSGNVGTEIKTGDSTRSLVGMIYSNASSQFYSYLLSWFNRTPFTVVIGTGNLTNTNTNVSVVATLGLYPNWADENVNIVCCGQGSTTGAYARFDVGIDSAVFSGTGQYAFGSASVPVTVGGAGQPSEGFHTYQLLASAASGSGTWSWLNVQTTITSRG